MAFAPKLSSDLDWINAYIMPPSGFIPVLMKLLVVFPAKRDRELIADFSCHCTRLCKADVVSFGWDRAAQKAWLR